ncbi:hypothetical protein BZL41_06170 [Pseudomonas sp. PIC25]|nr:hypothetical protein BZL41_06170 [Pseudomonas sp. PIC25]
MGLDEDQADPFKCRLNTCSGPFQSINLSSERIGWPNSHETIIGTLHETVERTLGLLAAVGRSRLDQGGELGTQFKIEFQ